MSGKNMNTSYDFESCWKYISGNYDADILDTKEHFMNQLKYMMEAAYEKGYDAGFKDGKERQKNMKVIKEANYSTHDTEICEGCDCFGGGCLENSTPF